MQENQNEKVLQSFVAHCRQYPTERFWQALRNWSGENFIMASSDKAVDFRDTFYWHGKSK